jgi:hypothetical protein
MGTQGRGSRERLISVWVVLYGSIGRLYIMQLVCSLGTASNLYAAVRGRQCLRPRRLNRLVYALVSRLLAGNDRIGALVLIVVAGSHLHIDAAVVSAIFSSENLCMLYY